MGKYARHGNVKYQFYMLPLQQSNLHHENIVTFIKDNFFLSLRHTGQRSQKSYSFGYNAFEDKQIPYFT